MCVLESPCNMQEVSLKIHLLPGLICLTVMTKLAGQFVFSEQLFVSAASVFGVVLCWHLRLTFKTFF